MLQKTSKSFLSLLGLSLAGSLALVSSASGELSAKEDSAKPIGQERASEASERATRVGIKFISISGGAFYMGSNDGHSDAKPVHRVTVSAFEMSESEVTVEQYRQCVEAGTCTKPNTGTSCNWGKAGREDHPINCVDWGQARTFARWAGGDLPTEAQWEYAARGGQSFKHAGSSDVGSVGWYAVNARGSTHPVKRKQKNGYGLYDMSGNVREWTLDEWRDNYSGASGSGDQAWGSLPTCSTICDSGSLGRMYRGGGWNDSASDSRVAHRAHDDPKLRHPNLGFRVSKLVKQEKQEKQELKQKGASAHTKRVGVRFISIPGGAFYMGSNDGHSDEKPVHRVTVSAFEMSESEVTVGQYRECVEAGVCTEPNTGMSCNWGKSGREDHPINCVDWGQARTFARWAGGDLPTEAQWEYAARGGQIFQYAGSNDVGSAGWYAKNARGLTRPVKQKQKNGYGLYDMSGNVWEWTLDGWRDSYSGAPSSGDQARGSLPKCSTICDRGSLGRVYRGGGCNDRASYLRVAYRTYDDPRLRRLNLGFRVRRTLP